MSLLPYKLAVLSMIAISFSGCEKAQPTVYEIPKENRSVNVSSAKQNTAPAVVDTAKMEILPGMQESADSAPEISYRVPQGWTELEPSGIRKGNFKIEADNGTAEVTILTFPGDVGGTLANINRWRDQIGLNPITSKDTDALGETYPIAKHEALYIRLEGESQSILGAILPFHGSTWFFKMIGDTQPVLDNDEAMKQFLNSIQFGDHTD